MNTLYKHLTNTFILYIFLVLINCANKDCVTKKSLNQNETLSGTGYSNKKSINFITDFIALHEDGDINVVIEIPSGTREKWEVDKSDGTLQLTFLDSLPRIVNYLGYPCNYGMIPQTLLPKKFGGEGDPLDVIVLGDPLARGSVVKCKLLGVLYLMDHGEKDDKLIAAKQRTPFYNFDGLEALDENYIGIIEILQLRFTNYKGAGKIKWNWKSRCRYDNSQFSRQSL